MDRWYHKLYYGVMAVRMNNSFEGSFENMTKQATKTVKTVVSDIKQQVTGEQIGQPVTNVGVMEQLGLRSVAPEQKKDLAEKDQQKLNEVRANLGKLDQEIAAAKQRRMKEQQTKMKEEQEKKQKKNQAENKKKQDPMWLRNLTGKTGSQEGNRGATG